MGFALDFIDYFEPFEILEDAKEQSIL